MKVVIAGGGTAGHVNPGLALADALAPEDVTFVGTLRGAEARLVPAAGLPLETVEVRGFDRSRPWALPAVAATAAGAVGEARSILRGIRPDVLVGMGGYVSLPGCIAARSLRIPVVLHEQNAVLGLAHRVCKPLARKVAVSFEETLSQAGRKGVLTGNPVSRALTGLDVQDARRRAHEAFGLASDRKTLLVFGGSQGARTLNEAGVGLALDLQGETSIQIVHVTGRDAHASVRERTSGLKGDGLIYRSVPYVEEMGLAYAAADLALCRGGASTVAELQAVGLPAVIVPYPYHRDRQQERHGRALEKRGAALVMNDGDVSPESLRALLIPILTNEERLRQMRENARAVEAGDAAERLAAVVRRVVR